MPNIYSIIRKPIMTEKSSLLLNSRKISFEVIKNATKYQIKTAFKLLFNIKSEGIRTMIIRGKKKRIGRICGKKKNRKKVIISINKNINMDNFSINNK
jgi:large subunit ribosomal protein L23